MNRLHRFGIISALSLIACGLHCTAASAQWDVSQPKPAVHPYSDAQGRFMFGLPEKWKVESMPDSTVFRWDNAAVTLLAKTGPSKPASLATDAVARVKAIGTDYREYTRSDAPVAGQQASSVTFTAKSPKGEGTRGRIVAIADKAVGITLVLTTPAADFDAANALLDNALASLTFGSAQTPGATLLAERTRVKVRILEGLSSSHAKKGEEVRYEVVDDVLGPNREVLVARGSTAYGAVTRASRRGMFGKPGKLDISIEYVRAIDGTRVPLRANEDMYKSGRNNTSGMAAATLLVAPVGIFINGRDANIKKGTEFEVFVSADTSVATAKATTAPVP